MTEPVDAMRPRPPLGPPVGPLPAVELRGLNGRIWHWCGSVGAVVARWPRWLQVTLVWVAARLLSFAIFAAVALHQGTSPWGPAKPDYLHFIAIWDSTWYRSIADGGYPAVLPRDANGVVEQNQWAFYPLYPLLVRAISTVTGADWLHVAPVVSLLAGLAAVLVMDRLFRLFAQPGTALWGVIFFATFPVSAVLQVPYAESLNTLLLAGSLYLLVRQRYLLAIPVVLLLGLSRPAGVPFAALVLAHLALRLWRDSGFRGDGAALAKATGLALASLAAAAAWPVIAWAGTGTAGAYTDTETAWRGESLILFQPWFDTGRTLFGPVLGILAPVLLLMLALLYVNSRPVRSLGADLQLWCLAYFGYLLAVLHPQTSTFRLLLPLFPLALAAAALSRSRAYRGAVLLLFLLLQIVWVAWLWAWTQLPGGGDYPP
jgi:hypothetical protein